MKTKTFGEDQYVVVKYIRNEKGFFDVITNIWLIAENAFKDCRRHREQYGEDMAYVLVAKQCMIAE